MVKTFGEAADFAAFRVIDGDIYRVAWAKTMQVEKTEDGKEKESSLCDYMLERYDYKPSMEFVLNDILSSGEQASMEEIREISEGLGSEPLEYMKKAMLAYIEKYDASSSVNSFLLNGMEVWLDKATRVGLMNSTSIAKTMGQQKTTLWLGSYQLEVDCDKAIQLLSALEMYALECFNVTAAHKKAVSELDNIEGVLTYDYRAGYPDKLKMEV
jgi:hypothetical protein